MSEKSQSINIRTAKPSDLDWLVFNLRKFSDFYDTKKKLFSNEEFARQGMHQMMTEHLVLVAEKQNQPIGFISGYIMPHPFNSDIKVLTETFWWVEEDYRGSRAGLMLLNAFTQVGKEKADWVTCTLESNSPVNDKCLLTRGYRLHERSYLLEV